MYPLTHEYIEDDYSYLDSKNVPNEIHNEANLFNNLRSNTSISDKDFSSDVNNYQNNQIDSDSLSQNIFSNKDQDAKKKTFFSVSKIKKEHLNLNNKRSRAKFKYTIFKQLWRKIRRKGNSERELFNPILQKLENDIENLLIKHEDLKKFPYSIIGQITKQHFEIFYARKLKMFNLDICQKYMDHLKSYKVSPIITRIKKNYKNKGCNNQFLREKNKHCNNNENNLGTSLEKKEKPEKIFKENKVNYSNKAKTMILEEFLEFVHSKVINQNELNHLIEFVQINTKFFDPFKKSYIKTTFAKFYLNFLKTHKKYQTLNSFNYLKSLLEDKIIKKPNHILTLNVPILNTELIRNCKCDETPSENILNCTFNQAFLIFIKEKNPMYPFNDVEKVEMSFISYLVNS